ncbi:hypothetical protein PR048_024262 [Dryococelus australis]|uniref:Uncharacterized protein n=1 Tax=Dryococelus australis TaxID=614101 RepID=A0ABQ9GN54_9NEOP|nr:hypothetical protein PR048_024262 [Dryococelus australis]
MMAQQALMGNYEVANHITQLCIWLYKPFSKFNFDSSLNYCKTMQSSFFFAPEKPPPTDTRQFLNHTFRRIWKTSSMVELCYKRF